MTVLKPSVLHRSYRFQIRRARGKGAPSLPTRHSRGSPAHLGHRTRHRICPRECESDRGATRWPHHDRHTHLSVVGSGPMFDPGYSFPRRYLSKLKARCGEAITWWIAGVVMVGYSSEHIQQWYLMKEVLPTEYCPSIITCTHQHRARST